MALKEKSENNKEKQKTVGVSKKRLYFAAILGVILLIVPVALIYFDPVILLVQHRLRLENGSMLHSLMVSRFTSTRIQVYLFNVSNAERFLDGTDEKMKLDEIGPFVYQEYRNNIDVEINKNPGIMTYSPKIETVFIPEESIGDPKDINVTVPNIVMLSATAMMSKYSFLIRQLYNIVAARSRSRPFVTIRAYDHIWGYSDPLIQLANGVVPGLIYFKSVGLFERMYDIGVDHRLEVGTTHNDRFSVKKDTKIQPKNASESSPTAIIDSTYTYTDAYEGAAFPPYLTPERPLNIYRHGLCKTFQLEYQGTKRMSYGGDAFLYHFHRNTFNDQTQCTTDGWCPEGIMDLADCFFGFPIVLSKGHFFDADPRLLDMVEGLKPNKTIHDTQIVIDPIIGVSTNGSMSLQLNLALADVGYNTYTRRLKNTVIPISNILVRAPPMIPEVSTALDLMYKKRPIIMIASQIICTILAILLLSYLAKNIYTRICQYRAVKNEKDIQKTQIPLLIN